MESKKQLVIVPPMSGPLQKLNEVLGGIADEENIEISIIENPKELSQFVGSAGQCLIAFSNAKSCAMFLQEYRFLLAKNHSKVILLTPKEIPAKTLIKFTKVGLTESILESSPPKTLLYKVKLLLRSIKSSTAKQEESDQVVKSMLDTNQLLTNKGELGTEKLDNNEQESVNYLAEERSKFKTAKDETTLDTYEDLKGKNNYQEESIDTHWKSKQKKETNIDFTHDDEKENKKEENLNDIDMYYRGNKKANTIDLFESEDLYGKTKQKETEENLEEDFTRKKAEETIINLDFSKEKKKEQANEDTDESDHYKLKTTEETFSLDAADESPKKNQDIDEDPIERKRRELKELDDLIEAAQKKKAEEKNIDLGGNYRGDINNNTFELEEADQEEKIKKEEYDNSETGKDKKQNIEEIELDLSKAKRAINENEEEIEKEKKKKTDELLLSTGEMSGKNSESENIDTTMQGKIGKKQATTINLEDGAETESDKLDGLEEDTDFDSRKKSNEVEIHFEKSKNNKEALEENQDTDEYNRKNIQNNDIDLDLDSSKEALLEENEDASGQKRSKETNLNLAAAGEAQLKEKNQLEEETDIAVKKRKQVDLELLDADGNRIHNGKVDQIDTYYRKGDKKKSDQNWDNLTTKNRDIELKLDKASSKDDINIDAFKFKDAGEITIDYRKLKEEFDAIARNGISESSDAIEGTRAKSGEIDEDKGSFKVVDVNARGFDFAINMINLTYRKDTKNNDFYRTVSEELIKQYNGYTVFYQYKLADKKHFEAFDSFSMLTLPSITNEIKEWWNEYKKEESIFSDYFMKTMSTWICREIKGQKNGEEYWEDVELPSWAQNELTSKKVELVFPYFDGVDRMGIALVFFPDGIDSKMEKHILVTLETARTILLDSVQRKASTNLKDDENNEDENSGEKNKILNLFSGMFNRNKAS